MKILWIDPVGTDGFDAVIGKILKDSAAAGTTVDVVSLPEGRPLHLEYHAYEGLVTSDIAKLVYHLSAEYDGIVIGCFYDVGLREAREVSRRAVVTAPCQSVEPSENSGWERTSGTTITSPRRATECVSPPGRGSA